MVVVPNVKIYPMLCVTSFVFSLCWLMAEKAVIQDVYPNFGRP